MELSCKPDRMFPSGAWGADGTHGGLGDWDAGHGDPRPPGSIQETRADTFAVVLFIPAPRCPARAEVDRSRKPTGWAGAVAQTRILRERR